MVQNSRHQDGTEARRDNLFTIGKKSFPEEEFDDKWLDGDNLGAHGNTDNSCSWNDSPAVEQGEGWKQGRGPGNLGDLDAMNVNSPERDFWDFSEEAFCPACGSYDLCEIPDDTMEEFSLVKACNACGEFIGFDATMDEAELDFLIQDIIPGVRTSPCEKCSNTDHSQYVFDEITGETRIRCMVCNSYVDYEEQESASAKAPAKFCKQCLNDDPSQFVPDESESGPRDRCMLCSAYTDEPVPKKMSYARRRMIPIDASQIEGVTDRLLCYCGKTNFNFYRSKRWKILHAECSDCLRLHTLDDWQRFLSLSAESSAKILPRSKIKHMWELYPSDHIAWHRSLGYWHHGIVSEVRGRTLQIIEYSGNPVEKANGRIREHWLETNPEEDLLYRYDYNPAHCFPAEEVLERARSRLEERKYGLYSNNCEHFATWCKTGYGSSSQVINAVDRVKHAGKAVAKIGGFRDASLRALKSAAGKVLSSGGVQTGASSATSAVSKLGGVTPMALLELKTLASRLHEYDKARKKGEVTQGVLTEMKVEEVAKTTSKIGLGTLGAVLLPINPVVGQTLGYILGQIAAPVTGRGALKLMRLLPRNVKKSIGI